MQEANGLRTGGCHCGAVRYEVEAALDKGVTCNCSICQAKGTVLAFAPASSFRILEGEDSLTEYRFNTNRIAHLFCAICGVQPFSRAVAPDGTPTVAINLRTVDGIDLDAVATQQFDGRSR